VIVIVRHPAVGNLEADRLVARAMPVVGPVPREVKAGSEGRSAEVDEQRHDLNPRARAHEEHYT
jgi:hypothetical protein